MAEMMESKPEVKPEVKKEPAAKPEMKNNSEGLASKMEKKPAAPKAKAEKSAGGKGGFTATHIEHHANGSHTVHHQHKDPSKDVKHAVEGMQGVHDSLEQNVGNPSMGAAPMTPEPTAPMAAEPAAGAMAPTGM